MEKYDTNVSLNHGLSINERKLLNITGVLKIESFDNEEFLLETSMGFLVIRGNSLEIVKLDTKDGVITIKGSIDGVEYLENFKKHGKQKMFDKIFKWV